MVVGQLGDVDQRILAGHQLNERAEGHDAGDLAGVNLAGFDFAGEALDAVVGGLAGGGVDRGDEDDPVVFDADVGAGFLFEAADVASARADQLADFFLRDIDSHDARGVGRHFVARLGDALGHHVHDFEPRVARLVQGAGEDLEVDSLDLHVHLQRGDALAAAGDLEVHVAEVVFQAGNVGQDRDVIVALDQAHGDAGDGGADRYAGVHHREHGGADAGHGGAAVGGEHLGDDADGVGEFLEGRQDRLHGALAEHAVADRAAAGVAHAARLAGREGREVVVVHEALAVLGVEVVKPLRHAAAGEGGEGEHLGFAALEESGAVRAGHEVGLGAERAQVGRAAPVGALAALEDVGADDLLFELAERIGVGLRVFAVGHGVQHGGADGLAAGVGFGFVAAGGEGGFEVVAGALVDEGQRVGVDRRGSELALGGADLLGELQLQLANFGDRLLAEREGVDQQVLGHLARFGLDHRDRVVRAGDDEVEVALFELGEGGLEHQLAVDVADSHRGDGAVEGDVGDAERGAGGDRAQGVGRVLHIDGEDRDDQLGVVVVALGEERADRSVGEPRGEDRGGGGPAFAAEEGAGDAPGGVEPLLEFNREGEEVDARAWLGGGGGAQHHGVAVADGDGAAGLVGELALFDDQSASGDFRLNRVCHSCSWSLHAAGSSGLVWHCSALFGLMRLACGLLSGARRGRCCFSARSARLPRRSAPQPEFRDQGAVASHVLAVQVGELASASADELHQSAPRGVVVLVLPQMGGQPRDSLGQLRHLDLGRAGVGVVAAVFARDGGFFFPAQHSCVSASGSPRRGSVLTR